MSRFGSVEATHNLWLFFEKQVEIFETARNVAMINSNVIAEEIVLLLYAIKDSSESFGFLTQRGKLRDSYVIARTIFETAVNVCFILADRERVTKATKHAKQKAYRDLERELSVNNKKIKVQWTGTIDLTQFPDLENAISEYTGKGGREITSWTLENVKERVEIIELKYGSNIGAKFQFGILSIYRHASEIAHGTLFGALYALGLTNPRRPNSPEELAEYERSNISMLLMMIGLILGAVTMVLAKELDQEELASNSIQASEALKHEEWAADLF